MKKAENATGFCLPFGADARTLALWAVASVFAATGAHAQTQTPIPTVKLGVQQAGASTFLDGVIQPVQQSTVSAQASGRIATFLVKAGDKVKSGQLVATIDDREAAVGLQRSQAQVDQASADLRNAQANFDRTKDLQTKGFVSRAALDSADAQLKSAKAQRDQASAATQQSNLAQGFTKVTAPFDGWVLQTDAQAGDLAVPGKPLLVIYAPLPLRAVVQVPASRATHLGQAATVQVQAGGAEAGQWITPSSRSIVPSSGATTPAMILIRVDLPAPFSPSTAWMRPASMMRCASCKARTPP